MIDELVVKPTVTMKIVSVSVLPWYGIGPSCRLYCIVLCIVFVFVKLK